MANKKKKHDLQYSFQAEPLFEEHNLDFLYSQLAVRMSLYVDYFAIMNLGEERSFEDNTERTLERLRYTLKNLKLNDAPFWGFGVNRFSNGLELKVENHDILRFVNEGSRHRTIDYDNHGFYSTIFKLEDQELVFYYYRINVADCKVDFNVLSPKKVKLKNIANVYTNHMIHGGGSRNSLIGIEVDGLKLPLVTEVDSDFEAKYYKKAILELSEHAESTDTSSRGSKKQIKNIQPPKSTSQIFISHASADKELVDAFVDSLLLLGIGLNEGDVFCTSVEGMGIKNGDDFRESIKHEIEGCPVTILLITQNYKRSEMCLNEMGASWVLSKHVFPLILEPINYKNVGVLMEPKQIAQLTVDSDLDSFQDDLCAALGIEGKKATHWNKYKKKFVNVAASHANSINTGDFGPADPKSFFGSFLKEGVDLKYILAKAHPNLLDCKIFYSVEVYKQAFDAHCKQIERSLEMGIDPIYPKYKFMRILKNSYWDAKNGKLAGGMTKLALANKLNSNITYYHVKFLENQNDSLGFHFLFFCYMNGRWVWFPKPWHTRI
ncbi:MAG: toll/interleukin-1 receptor domain-containing protein [Colwellia sp.]|nr:toll/interleukin-1 receptor domain-containing protein [Colwellia sp.]